MSEKNNEEDDFLSSNSILTSTLNPPLPEEIEMKSNKSTKISVLILFILILLLAANQYFGWIGPNKLTEPNLISGPQGEQGPAGKDGIIGKDGAPGPQGKTGATGAQGPAGNPGSSGSSGATGATGPAGAVGPTGPAGGGSGSGTGTVSLGTCDDDISISMNSKYVSYSGVVANNWVVDVLTISNIDSTACAGKKVTVVLVQAGGSALVTSNQLTITGSTLLFSCTPNAAGACTGSGWPTSPILRSNLIESVTLEVAA
jgi:hypothetical protein